MKKKHLPSSIEFRSQEKYSALVVRIIVWALCVTSIAAIAAIAAAAESLDLDATKMKEFKLGKPYRSITVKQGTIHTIASVHGTIQNGEFVKAKVTFDKDVKFNFAGHKIDIPAKVPVIIDRNTISLPMGSSVSIDAKRIEMVEVKQGQAGIALGKGDAQVSIPQGTQFKLDGKAFSAERESRVSLKDGFARVTDGQVSFKTDGGVKVTAEAPEGQEMRITEYGLELPKNAKVVARSGDGKESSKLITKSEEPLLFTYSKKDFFSAKGNKKIGLSTPRKFIFGNEANALLSTEGKIAVVNGPNLKLFGPRLAESFQDALGLRVQFPSAMGLQELSPGVILNEHLDLPAGSVGNVKSGKGLIISDNGGKHAYTVQVMDNGKRYKVYDPQKKGADKIVARDLSPEGLETFLGNSKKVGNYGEVANQVVNRLPIQAQIPKEYQDEFERVQPGAIVVRQVKEAKYQALPKGLPQSTSSLYKAKVQQLLKRGVQPGIINQNFGEFQLSPERRTSPPSDPEKYSVDEGRATFFGSVVPGDSVGAQAKKLGFNPIVEGTYMGFHHPRQQWFGNSKSGKALHFGSIALPSDYFSEVRRNNVEWAYVQFPDYPANSGWYHITDKGSGPKEYRQGTWAGGGLWIDVYAGAGAQTYANTIMTKFGGNSNPRFNLWVPQSQRAQPKITLPRV